MKILIGPLALPGSVSMDDLELENPGIGGSEYHSLVLASVLREQHEISVWVESGSLEMPSVHVISRPERLEPYDLQVAFTSRANEATPDKYPLIAISHHPFDSHIADLPKRTLVIANVGEYQLKSNEQIAAKAGIPQIWLPIFFCSPRMDEEAISKSKSFLVGHLSSLHPSKGFHDVLAGWMKYISQGGDGLLEVVGGQSLYGLSESHEFLPVSKAYGARLLKIMGGQVHPTVRFLGRVRGVSSLVRRWDLAILNPKAFGESANISLADCWRESTPVIAGNRFGQRDLMGRFPTLAASTPRQIHRKLKHLSQNQNVLDLHQSRSKLFYKDLYLRGLASRKKWYEVIDAAIASPDNLPRLGLDVKRSSLWLRALISFERAEVNLQNLASMALNRAKKILS
jgi:hypothetical protein